MTVVLRDRVPVAATRRGVIGGAAVLSATAVALLGGKEAMAAKLDQVAAGSPQQDVEILNTALGLEQQAIAAYGIGAGAGLLSPGALSLASLFMRQHKEHAELLTGAIKKLGGTPVAPKSDAEYKAALNVASIKSANDILNLAAGLEKGAANAYLSLIPSFSDPGLGQVAGRLAADETMHWTALAGALQLQLPGKALSWGV